MRKELDEVLQNTFPWLKRPEIKRDKPYQYVKGYYTRYENYGFECSDGWFQILYDLNQEIADRFEEAGRPVNITIKQVKSKWGHLCYYYYCPNSDEGDTIYDEIAQIVEKYENIISRCTCEWCGAQPASLRRKGYRVYTLCDECNRKNS